MGILSGLRTIKQLMAGELTSAQLQTHLTNANNLASFKQAMRSPYQLDVLFSKPTAYAAAFGSALACRALVQSKLAFNLILTSVDLSLSFFASTASFDAVMAHAVARETVFADTNYVVKSLFPSNNRSLLWNSDTYLGQFAASANAVAGLKLLPGYNTKTMVNISTSQLSMGLTPAGNHIVVAHSSTNNFGVTTTLNLSGRRAGSTVGSVAISVTNGASLPLTTNVIAVSTPLNAYLSIGTSNSTNFNIFSFPVD